jgi:F-type H+-transporting ATPase subunit epsilon
MADTILLQLVSPERMLVEEQVSDLQIPALDGYIGVLPGGAPLLSELKPGGVVSYRLGDREKVLAVYGGFVEVLPDRVRILADNAQPGEEINLGEAQKKLDEANKALASMGGNEASDPAVALDEALRAQAAFDAAQAAKRKTGS